MSYFQCSILKANTALVMHTVGRFSGFNFMLCSCVFKSLGIDLGGKNKMSLLANASNVTEECSRKLVLLLSNPSGNRYAKAEV